jgi:hypothetical protein
MKRLLTLALALSLGGCAMVQDLWPSGPKQARSIGPRDRQVAVFDGHELYVDYACEGGATLRVRFLGAWADARMSDGAIVRLARTDAGGQSPNFENAGYRLSGPGLSPTWTTPAGAARCDGTPAE